MKSRVVNGIELLELPNYAYQKFKKCTKNNDTITHDIAQRKLTRNVLLGQRIINDSKYNQELYMYGRLKIRVNSTIDGRRVITGIWNNCKQVTGWSKNRLQYEMLNCELELN